MTIVTRNVYFLNEVQKYDVSKNQVEITKLILKTTSFFKSTNRVKQWTPFKHIKNLWMAIIIYKFRALSQDAGGGPSSCGDPVGGPPPCRKQPLTRAQKGHGPLPNHVVRGSGTLRGGDMSSYCVWWFL